MGSKYCADLTFGLQPEALAMLQLLAGMEMDFTNKGDIVVKTFPWYNGWEKCVCIVFQYALHTDGYLFVIFGRDYDSEKLFVEHWLGRRYFNCPTLESLAERLSKEKAVRKRRHFGFDEMKRAVTFVYELMAEMYVHWSSLRKVATQEKKGEQS